MASMRSLANKLQTALAMKGRYIKINQYQHWSEKSGRMVTKFVACEKRDVDGTFKTVSVCESYQMADIVKTLAAILNDGGGGDACR